MATGDSTVEAVDAGMHFAGDLTGEPIGGVCRGLHTRGWIDSQDRFSAEENDRQNVHIVNSLGT